MSKLITVQGVEGRVAYSAPTGGVLIPVDTPKTFAESKWLKDRLAAGDIAFVTTTKN